MKLRIYPFSSREDFREFAFDSHGPKGTVRKIVRFTPFSLKGMTCFNLGFGDAIEGIEDFDDQVTSNNSDRNMVLSTVAAIVVEFTNHLPYHAVYAQGSSDTRNRLYRIMILANLSEVEGIMDVYGYCNGEWQPFTENVNYEAYLVFRKRNQ